MGIVAVLAVVSDVALLRCNWWRSGDGRRTEVVLVGLAARRLVSVGQASVLLLFLGFRLQNESEQRLESIYV